MHLSLGSYFYSYFFLNRLCMHIGIYFLSFFFGKEVEGKFGKQKDVFCSGRPVPDLTAVRQMWICQ